MAPIGPSTTSGSSSAFRAVTDTGTALAFIGDAREVSQIGRPVALASFLLNVSDWPDKPRRIPPDQRPAARAQRPIACPGPVAGGPRHPPGCREHAAGFAISVSVAWLLHPFLASTSFHAIQRMTLLAATFSLVCFLAYLHGRALLESRPHRGFAWMTFGLVIPGALGVLSKESAALTPILIAVTEFTILNRYRPIALRSFWWWRLVFFGVPAARIDRLLGLLPRGFSANGLFSSTLHARRAPAVGIRDPARLRATDPAARHLDHGPVPGRHGPHSGAEPAYSVRRGILDRPRRFRRGTTQAVSRCFRSPSCSSSPGTCWNRPFSTLSSISSIAITCRASAPSPRSSRSLGHPRSAGRRRSPRSIPYCSPDCSGRSQPSGVTHYWDQSPGRRHTRPPSGRRKQLTTMFWNSDRSTRRARPSSTATSEIPTTATSRPTP